MARCECLNGATATPGDSGGLGCSGVASDVISGSEETSAQQPAQECLERIEASTDLHGGDTAGQGYYSAPGMKQGLSAP